MHEDLMEKVVTQEKATAAWRAVKRNGGAPGIDSMTTQQWRDHVRKHWKTIRAKLLAGTYVPSPVRRSEISNLKFQISKGREAIGHPDGARPMEPANAFAGAASPLRSHLQRQ